LTSAIDLDGSMPPWTPLPPKSAIHLLLLSMQHTFPGLFNLRTTCLGMLLPSTCALQSSPSSNHPKCTSRSAVLVFRVQRDRYLKPNARMNSTVLCSLPPLGMFAFLLSLHLQRRHVRWVVLISSFQQYNGELRSLEMAIDYRNIAHVLNPQEPMENGWHLVT